MKQSTWKPLIFLSSSSCSSSSKLNSSNFNLQLKWSIHCSYSLRPSSAPPLLQLEVSPKPSCSTYENWIGWFVLAAQWWSPSFTYKRMSFSQFKGTKILQESRKNWIIKGMLLCWKSDSFITSIHPHTFKTFMINQTWPLNPVPSEAVHQHLTKPLIFYEIHQKT